VRIAYLFARYPVLSQTFIDTEILALERMGVELEIYSIYAPPTSFRHGHHARMKAPIFYAPPQSLMKLGEQEARKSGRWPVALVADHDRRFGTEHKAALRARNALYLADLFKERAITHCHVHFANTATHTAIFVKHLSGIPYSMSTHGQDFMVDLGSDDLLREFAKEAEFVANETEWSKGVLQKLCPASADKMIRVFNGMDLTNFQKVSAVPENPAPRIVSTGRLIEFKGFHHLIAASAKLRDRGVAFQCDIVGEGPWRAQLQAQIDELKLGGFVRLTGALPQEEVFRALRECDIFALACIVDRNGASDVFPTVILESMASAKPVVSTRIAGVPEQIVDGETGFICEPGDEEGLANALEKVLRSPELRRQFGEAGRRRLEKEFSVEKTVLEIKSAFEKIVKPSTAPKRAPAGLGVLVHKWPGDKHREADLYQLYRFHPQLRIYAALASFQTIPENSRSLVSRIDFLPDGMVLEGEWRQESEFAHRIETVRVEFTPDLSSEWFLQQARYALYMRDWIARDAIKHLHAMTTAELVWGWMLHQWTGVTLSVTIEDKGKILPKSAMIQLIEACSGVRFEKAKTISDAASAHPNANSLYLLVHRLSRPLEDEWLEYLAKAAGITPAK
jgi:glycosyltransferase involved in cell wall biosynthesis